MPEQKIMIASINYRELDDYLQVNCRRSVLLVCDSSMPFLRISKYFATVEQSIGLKVVPFEDFQPNPTYESVVKGVKLFHEERCSAIIAVGGGSAMDVAKCIKLYSNMDSGQNYLQQKIVANEIKLLAVPTTAGTGSEATCYAVIYFNGEKQSVSDDSCIPSFVLQDVSALKTLPMYQRKSTMLDALCHAIESFWSINSTDESREYSKEAIRLILANKDMYLANDEKGNTNMLMAAYIAGKAINITQTTAGHAMCYKLTSLFGIAHGHAASLCVAKLWPYMVNHMNESMDPRGIEYLHHIFYEISQVMGCSGIDESIELYQNILCEMEIYAPIVRSRDEFEILNKSVNPVRLKNNPVRLDEKAIGELYHEILNED